MRGKTAALDYVFGQVKTIHIVQHGHVERRGRRAFLLVAAHVEIS